MRKIVTAFVLAAATSGCSTLGDSASPRSRDVPTAPTIGDPMEVATSVSARSEDLGPMPPTTPVAVPTAASSSDERPRQIAQLLVRSREAWGAALPDRQLETHEIGAVTIHHTGRPHDDTPTEERLRQWQQYHQSIGFADIAYHMVVAEDGTVYEGRTYDAVGATRTSYDPTGHFLPAIDGMFGEAWDSPTDDDNQPDGADTISTAQLAALVDLLSWASAQFDVDPREYTGHRDHVATACPGTIIHDMIQSGEIASLVRERMEHFKVELVYVSS